MGANEPVVGCIMCDSLYVKPTGNLPCWDDVGEDLILRTLDEHKLIAGEEEPVFSTPELVEIRRAFLEQRVPHKDFCHRCPLYGHGVARSLTPATMNVLHVEPAYLCQLACPQCFSPKERLTLEKPPYYMTLEFYCALLDQLVDEGVERIRFVHFEGRGEPLLNKSLGAMIEATKERYPDTFAMVTTHGNFPHKPWMHTCGLDVLRLSVDGAFEESYAQYRVGGHLQKPLALMEAIQRESTSYPDSNLRVEWKYILFEWNDSDEEIRRANTLALERGVRLRFCLTHTPGRSLRFQDDDALRLALEDLAPGAGVESTFQLRQEPSEANTVEVLGEHVEALLIRALRELREGQDDTAADTIAQALRRDPGLELSSGTPWHNALEEILDGSFHPSTLVALANIALVQQQWIATEQLFRRYLERAPTAIDRGKIERTLIELAVGNRLGCHVEQAALVAPENRRAAEAVALEIDSAIPRHVLDTPNPLDSHLDLILRLASPTTKQQLAALRRASDDWPTAQRLSDQRQSDQRQSDQRQSDQRLPEVDAPEVESPTVPLPTVAR